MYKERDTNVCNQEWLEFAKLLDEDPADDGAQRLAKVNICQHPVVVGKYLAERSGLKICAESEVELSWISICAKASVEEDLPARRRTSSG